jgi:hypothetical protein
LKRDQPGPCKICRENGDKCTFVLESNSNAIAQFSKPQPPQKPQKSKRISKKHRSKWASTPSVQHATDSLATPGRAWEILGEDAEKEFKKSSRGKEKGKRHTAILISPGLIPKTAGSRQKIIKTCFAHPIKFNYIPDTAGQHPCSWCSFPFFGLWGYGEVTVEVMPWGSALGNEEVAGGHSSKGGKESSKMCVACTFTRVRIMTCQAHLVRRIANFDARSFQPEMLERSFAALAEGDREGGELAMKTKWCSVCVAVAEYKCCTAQHYDDSAQQLSNGDVLEGCGLYLCATCNDTFERIEKSKGNNPNVVVVDSLVKIRGDELWKHRKGGDDVDRVRADAEFLTSKGELMVRMAQGLTVGGEEQAGASRKELDAGMVGMMKSVGRKKGKEKAKEKQKQKEVVFGGELTPRKPKVDIKGKGKAVPGVEYEESANGYRARSRVSEESRVWEDLCSMN